MASISQTSSKLFTSVIQDKETLGRIKDSVDNWHTESKSRYAQIEKGSAVDYKSNYFGAPLESEKGILKDYSGIAYRCLYSLSNSLDDKTSFFDDQRILATFDAHANLQGIAVLLFRKSTKNSKPFVEVEYILTALWNMNLNEPKFSHRTRGSGSALVAFAAQMDKQSKIIFVIAIKSAASFFSKKLGFSLTRRQIAPDSDVKSYKLAIAHSAIKEDEEKTIQKKDLKRKL